MIVRFFACLAYAAAIVISSGSIATAGAAAGHAARPMIRYERLNFRGRAVPTRLSELRSATADFHGKEVAREHRGFRSIDVHPAARLRSSGFAAAAIPIPIAANRPVVAADPDFFGFSGLTHYDQRTAGTGTYTNTQFSLEPPDQGLCAGNGYVVDAVNNAVAVYSNFGTRLTAPTALSEFFHLSPEIIRSTPAVFGTFISDPKCYFDRDTQRWFLTELAIATDPLTGNDLGSSSILLAVSQSGDPTAGYNIYSIDTTDAANPGCPCFGDQPLLGADRNGVFISTNEFPLFNNGFNGAQIYALSKPQLALGGIPSLVHIDAGSLPTPDVGGIWYSIQPAAAPDTGAAAQVQKGAEFFLSALDFFNLNDNRVAVWAVTNTRALVKSFPDVGVQHVVIKSVAYAAPPPATQEPGDTPLATSLGEPLEELSTNDDRMNQVVYADGKLWSGVNTAVRAGRGVNAGIAFFAVAPSFNDSGFLTARTIQQGYVAVAGQNLLYPSIGVNPHGGAIMAATLSGPNYDPTAIYVTQNGKVHIAGAAAVPDDGFTGYVAYGGNGVARWGDYSAAVADRDGSIWTATEYIPNAPRSPLADWGTFIGHVQVH